MAGLISKFLSIFLNFIISAVYALGVLLQLLGAFWPGVIISALSLLCYFAWKIYDAANIAFGSGPEKIDANAEAGKLGWSLIGLLGMLVILWLAAPLFGSRIFIILVLNQLAYSASRLACEAALFLLVVLENRPICKGQ